MACRSAIRARRVTASRSPRAISRRGDASTPRVSSVSGSERCTAGRTYRRRSCTPSVMSSAPCSIPPAVSIRPSLVRGMKRTRAIALIAAIALTALVAWIASHTYWADTQVPRPLKGEARVNPFYAAQRLAEALGAHTARDFALAIPSADSVVVLGAWHWSISASRRLSLERWVDSGGRLVVEGPLTGGEDEFE